MSAAANPLSSPSRVGSGAVCGPDDTVLLLDAKPRPLQCTLRQAALLIINSDVVGANTVRPYAKEAAEKARAVASASEEAIKLFQQLQGEVILARERAARKVVGVQAQVYMDDLMHSLRDAPTVYLEIRRVEQKSGLRGAAHGDTAAVGRLEYRLKSLYNELDSKGLNCLLFAGADIEHVVAIMQISRRRGYTCCLVEDCTLNLTNRNSVSRLIDSRGTDGGLLFSIPSAGQIRVSGPLLPRPPSPELELRAAHQDVALQPALSGGEQQQQQQQYPLQQLPASISELQRYYRSQLVTPEEVVRLVYDRIDAHRREHGSAAADAIWTHLQTREQALEAARALEAKHPLSGPDAEGLPPLYGVPFSVKDIIDVAGVVVTAALPDDCEVNIHKHNPTTSALVVRKLLDAGALFIGKTNMDQLATGLTGTRSPVRGAPCSVFSRHHVSGGSSSGAAVSVAAGMVSFALGTDTAGSGRIPAAFNGMVGFKPTKGTVSACGVLGATPSLDAIAVIAPTVDDVQAVWKRLVGYDGGDIYAKLPRAMPWQQPGYILPWEEDSFTFMIPPPNVIRESCCPEYAALFDAAVAVVQSAGGRLVPKRNERNEREHEASQGDHRKSRHTDYAVFEEAGQLFAKTNGALLQERIACFGEAFLRANLDKLHPATAWLFGQALDAAPAAVSVLRDQHRQRQLAHAVERVFDAYSFPSNSVGPLDVLVVPTAPLHPTFAEVAADPVKLNAKLGTFAYFANVVDMCGISVPAGTYVDGRDGGRTELPFGITVLGGPLCDSKVLEIARRIEVAFQKAGRPVHEEEAIGDFVTHHPQESQAEDVDRDPPKSDARGREDESSRDGV